MGRRLSRNAWLLFGGLVAVAVTVGAVAVRAGADSSPVLARVADQEINEDEFRGRYARYLLRSGLPDQPLTRSRFIQGMVENRLLALDAIRTGARETDEFQLTEERYRRKLLLDLFVRRTIYDSIRVEEAELRDAFQRLNTQVTARHLYAPTFEEAVALRERLARGETFEALAREVFRDSILAASGGSVGTFTFDEMDVAFEDAAYALEIGEVSDPVRTAQGYSIIRVDDRSSQPVLTQSDYARRRSTLAQYVVNRKRELGRRAYVRSLVDSLRIRLEPRSLDDLTRQVAGSFVLPDAESFDAWLDQPVVHFVHEGRHRTWTIRHFREEGRYTDPEMRAQVRSQNDLVEFIQALVTREVMLDKARRARLNRTPELETALEQAMIDWLAGVSRRALEPTFGDTLTASRLPEHLKSLRERYVVSVDMQQVAAVPLSGESNR